MKQTLILSNGSTIYKEIFDAIKIDIVNYLEDCVGKVFWKTW